MRALGAERIVDSRQAPASLDGEREVDDAAVRRRAGALDEARLLGPLDELGDCALGQRRATRRAATPSSSRPLPLRSGAAADAAAA